MHTFLLSISKVAVLENGTKNFEEGREKNKKNSRVLITFSFRIKIPHAIILFCITGLQAVKKHSGSDKKYTYSI